MPTSRPLTSQPRLGAIPPSAAEAQALQRKVDSGNLRYQYYTNPVQVLAANLPRYGFVGRFRLAEPIKIVIMSGRTPYDIYLQQLVKRSPEGAWFIVETARHVTGYSAAPGAKPTFTPVSRAGNPKLGVVHHTAVSTRAVQDGVDGDNRGLIYALNPIKVLAHNLGQLGFKTPVQITLPLKFLVNYRGKQYDVLLTQPVKKGEKGVWIISSIQRHRA